MFYLHYGEVCYDHLGLHRAVLKDDGAAAPYASQLTWEQLLEARKVWECSQPCRPTLPDGWEWLDDDTIVSDSSHNVTISRSDVAYGETDGPEENMAAGLACEAVEAARILDGWAS